MSRQNTQFLTAIRRHAKGKKITESVATQALSRWLYRGSGKKYLSLPVCEDGIGRSPDARPQRFRCPSTRTDFARWNPVKDHITGDRKGIVVDGDTRQVPFIAVDLDRHDASVTSQRHQEIGIQIGRQLCKIPHVKWLAEVNPNNGSLKFFGFRRSGDQFRLQEAKSLSSRIRHELIALGHCHDGNIEIFADNCKAIFLPLRRDKLTIANQGILPRVNRRIKDVRFYGMTVWENLRCYSALHFANWIYQGDSYDEATLITALRYACAGLPVEEPTESDSTEVLTGTRKVRSSARSEPVNNVPAKALSGANNYDHTEPCALKRNWANLLEYSRTFFRANKRLPSVEEALGHLKRNRLYSGKWNIHEAHRRQRVVDILGKISETFDSSLLQSNHLIKLDPGIRRWCRRHFPNGIVGHRQQVNELNMSVETQEVRVPARFVEHCVSVIAFCLNDHLANMALPVNRIKAIWSCVVDPPSWNQLHFKIVRCHLEKNGVVKIIDKYHQAGKAWKWEKGINFPTKMRDRQSGTKVRRVGASIKERPSTAGAREWVGKSIRKKRIHKSLYHPLPEFQTLSVQNKCYRGPPLFILVKWLFLCSD